MQEELYEDRAKRGEGNLQYGLAVWGNMYLPSFGQFLSGFHISRIFFGVILDYVLNLISLLYSDLI